MFETNCFQFRVANNFYGSNSSKTNGAAKAVCNKMKVNLVKYDDSDTSCHGYAGFFVKLDLDQKVNVEEFLIYFKEECGNQGLDWGEDKDICLASDQWISNGHIATDVALIAKKFLF